MIQVQVPPGVQEGQIVQVVDPNTNQPFSVQVPVGLQPGHVFSCALPTPTPSFAWHPNIPSPLTERLATAGGKLRLGLPQDAATGGSTTSVTNSSGTEICIIRVGPNMQSGVTLSLPDGSDCQSLTCGSDIPCSLTGTGGPGGKDFVIGLPDWMDGLGCGWQADPAIILKVGGECVFSLDRPAQPWMCPWLTITCCMGACCATCMECGPTYLVQMKGAKCGEVRSLGGCGDCCESPMDVIASDAAALHGALLCLCSAQWLHRFVSG